MRYLRTIVTAVALACAGPCFGLTLLQLEQTPNLSIQRVVSSADGAFDASAFALFSGDVRAVNVTVDVTCGRADCHPGTWHFTFRSTTGAPLGPGLYAGDGPTGPLDATYASSSLYCPTDHQIVTIRELAVDANDRLIRFAADFDRQCLAGYDASYSGIIRWHAGNGACEGQPDGTPCDDQTPCTADDACSAGQCLGAATVPCSPLTCDDGNPCTDDAVDRTACLNTPIQGSCWDLRYRNTLVVSALGRSCGCRLPPTTGRLALTDDGHFRFPGGRVDENACTSRRATVFPDEVGAWHQRGRARVLQTSNLNDLLAATEQCSGSLGMTVRRYGSRVRLSRDGTRLAGQQVMSGKVDGAPATARVVSKIAGVPGDGSARPSTIQLDQVAAAAQRCRRRLTACFR